MNYPCSCPRFWCIHSLSHSLWLSLGGHNPFCSLSCDFKTGSPRLNHSHLFPKSFTIFGRPPPGQLYNQAKSLRMKEDQVFSPCCALSACASKWGAVGDCPQATRVRHSPENKKSWFAKSMFWLTLNIRGRDIRRRREPAISSGTAATESNHTTGNMTCWRSLNRYSMPGTLCSKMFNWSRISTLMGIEDWGSSQKKLSWSFGSGCTPYWNCSA